MVMYGFFFKTPPIFLRVSGDHKMRKIANKTKEKFKLAWEPKV